MGRVKDGNEIETGLFVGETNEIIKETWSKTLVGMVDVIGFFVSIFLEIVIGMVFIGLGMTTDGEIEKMRRMWLLIVKWMRMKHHW